MPLIPRGLTPGFVQRIKDQVSNLSLPGVVDRTIQRVRDEVRPPKPDRARSPVDVVAVPHNVGMYEAAIRKAGREWRILRVRYNDNDRDLEPYSFRFWDKDDPTIPLLYAFCHKDQDTEAFKLKKIQDMSITNRFYGTRAGEAPKWDNEFARPE